MKNQGWIDTRTIELMAVHKETLARRIAEFEAREVPEEERTIEGFLAKLEREADNSPRRPPDVPPDVFIGSLEEGADAIDSLPHDAPFDSTKLASVSPLAPIAEDPPVAVQQAAKSVPKADHKKGKK